MNKYAEWIDEYVRLYHYGDEKYLIDIVCTKRYIYLFIRKYKDKEKLNKAIRKYFKLIKSKK